MGRARKFSLFAGAPETGKSTQLELMIKHRCAKYGEPAIILDPNHQAKWTKYPEIDLELLKRQRKNIYRIHTTDYEAFFDTVFNYCMGFQVISEDSSNWAKPIKNDKIYQNVIGLRHPKHDCDISGIFHTIKRIPDYLFEQANELVIFKTGETWDGFKHMVPEHLRESLQAAFYRVQNHADPHYWERFTLRKTGTK